MKNNFVRIAFVTALILLVPLVATQFTDEVDWNLFDFAAAGVLLFGAGATYELIARKSGNVAYRVAVGLAVVTALLLVWTNLAVGIIGSEDDPVNLMYGAVLAAGFLGAILARLEPQGMARVLFAMALVQVLVTVIVLTVVNRPVDPMEIGGNALFVTLFVGSALLFRRAGAGQTATA